MRIQQGLRRYGVEIALALLGLIVALLEAVIVHRSDIALLIAFIAALLAVSVAAIRQEIAQQSADRRILDAIPDPRWRRDAEEQLNQARVTFSSWAGGTRRVDAKSSLNYEIKAVGRATHSVRAVHLATQPDSLDGWDNPQRGFAELARSYMNLPPKVISRRILALDSKDPGVSQIVDGLRLISDERTIRVCRTQMQPRTSGGLGSELRIFWSTSDERRVSDLLIVDGEEVCTIERLGHDHFGNLEVVINSAIVSSFVEQFEDLWTASVQAQQCLPTETNE